MFCPTDSCEPILDTNRVDRKIKLSDNDRTATFGGEVRSYPGDPDGLDFETHLLPCQNGLTGRCYWEVEWKGLVSIGVSYKRFRRKGEDARSWFLVCYKNKYTVLHNGKEAGQHSAPFVLNRIGVYVDWPAGILSFFEMFSNTPMHIHTFRCTFDEPLYPAIRLWFNSEMLGCSASLLDL